MRLRYALLFAPIAVAMAAPVVAAPKAPAATSVRATAAGAQTAPQAEDEPKRRKGKFWRGGNGGIMIAAGLAAIAGIVVLVSNGGSSTPASP